MIRFLLKELISEKSFREGRRITLDEISAETGIGRNTLSRIANSKGYNCTTEIVDKLCIYFDVPVEEVMQHVKGGMDATERS
ncbi:MAG: helix-turn-helix transcriptional regulator [Candidatus Thiodiazotropha weberae]|nr:helix-turn-helix transcriptional regulator [Candidatus Thiodiazotropha lotti]MCG8011169.1 helix-turn-helix transcriptional regulator [Candidatus Thiodiazotropha lotti]MCW4210631.1 helix-turn-helix transcriptional regulator [Candidatus Thiodiazotropha lotti]MCW4216646.1 helix-turn-helix transcriptional regulator [Candidatus Thiodiazotropha lotti]